MAKQPNTTQDKLELIRANGADTQDTTLDWNTVAKPAAYQLNVTLEDEVNIPLSMRGICYKRFLGLIGSECIVEMKDSEGKTILGYDGNPRKHFSSVKFSGMFPKKLTSTKLKLQPKIMKRYKRDGLPAF